MPSSATITAFYHSFTAGNVIKSAEHNANWNAVSGHFVAIDPTTTTNAPTRSYDLGADQFRWRYVYGKPRFDMASTTGAMTIAATNDIVFMDSTAGTLTASLFAVANNTGCSFYLKNVGSANSVFYDGSGAEQIDNTITGNLIPGEGYWFYCTGVQWRRL